MTTILVINNDIDTMELLKDLLERKDFRVNFTSNQQDVIKMAKEISPALIILDTLQKDTLRDLKQDDVIKDIPVLLMTGYSLRDAQTEFLVEGVIEKPFIFQQLQTKVDSLLRLGDASPTMEM